MTEEKNEEIQEEEELELPEVAEGEEDTTDWKELALKQQGINKRLKTKIAKAKEAKEEEKPKEPEKPEEDKIKTKKSDEITLTTGDKALLKSYKEIKGTDELALCENWINKYKVDLEEMLEDEVFNAKLTKLREAKKVKDATPSSTKRSAGADTSTKDYWVNKYENGTPLKDIPTELRRDVLNARIKEDEQRTHFA